MGAGLSASSQGHRQTKPTGLLDVLGIRAVFRRVAKLAAGAVPAALVAGLGLPALGALVFLAIPVAGIACWVFGSDARANRVSRVLLAWRGNPGLPGPGRRRPAARPGAATAPPAPAAPFVSRPSGPRLITPY